MVSLLLYYYSVGRLTGEFPRVGPGADGKEVSVDGTMESDAGLPETCVRAERPKHCGRDEHYHGHDQAYRS